MRRPLHLWKAQVLPPIRGAQLAGYLDGSTPAPPVLLDVTKEDKTEKVPNPAYAPWVAVDQQVLGYLLNSLSKVVLTQVASITSSGVFYGAIYLSYGLVVWS